MLPTCLVALALTLAPGAEPADGYTFARPGEVRVRHAELTLRVDFERKQIGGEVAWTLERANPAAPLILDTRDVEVLGVTAGGAKLAYQLGKSDPIRGESLTIQLPPGAERVAVSYRTRPGASALQWLTPAQTAGKRKPFLFTQSQAIDARSWLPCQDTPGVRFTFDATVYAPTTAVMAAEKLPGAPAGAVRYRMDKPVPSYLVALAVGEMDFAPLGPRTGVYAEPAVLARAKAEFADLEDMLSAAEKLVGPYQWGRYDVLVLPPSFPFGGMENPRLTFASPTVLAGDKSLVSLLAHELAHSWSGNWVSNATWADFWLNEGFTVYLERRIIEAVYGPKRAEVEATLGERGLRRELAEMPAADQILAIDLAGRPPVDGLTGVPYEKGALFLSRLERLYGREAFDRFLLGYFRHFALKSITTATFEAYLAENLLKTRPELVADADVAAWLHAPGLPKGAPKPRAASLVLAEELAPKFAKGAVTAESLKAASWPVPEWLTFLHALPKGVGPARLAELDMAYHLSESGNAEVVFAWLELAVREGYRPADARLERFLLEQGRRRFVKPLYEALASTPAGKERAKAIYAKARETYHPATVEAVDRALK